MSANLYSLENEVFKAFLFYGVVMLLKTSMMSFLTTRKRFQFSAIRTSEDGYRVGSDPAKQRQALLPNENVERVRRCHRNDMENVYVFIFMALLYVGTDPHLTTAIWLFRVFAVSRITHTVVYLNGIPQPYRGVCFLTGVAVNLTMASLILKASLS